MRIGQIVKITWRDIREDLCTEELHEPPVAINVGMVVKQKLKTGDEWDCITARKWYCYLRKPGVSSGIKRRMRRRIRHEGKRECGEM